MKEIQSPAKVFPSNRNISGNAPLTIFLGGSIEMGTAANWQNDLKVLLQDTDVILYNPRRDDWDNTWVQQASNTQFNEQVTWEMDALDYCDKIVFYFDPYTKSPITLLELGLYAKSGKVSVCCPQGFWRRGNVEMVCERYGVPLCETLTELVLLISK